MNKSVRLRTLAAAAAFVMMTGAISAAEPVKVAFVYVDPVGDSGWTYQHGMGRGAVEKALGAKVKTTYVEKVPATADAERVVRQLAAAGNDLIFTTSFGYMEATLKVARLVPRGAVDTATR